MEDDEQTGVQPEEVGAYPAAQEELKAERVQLAEPALDRLKAERVQEELAAKPTERLRADQVRSMMQEMSGWRLSADGRSIIRRFRFPTLRAAMAFTALGLELTAGCLHQPGVSVHGNDVIVTFASSVGGLTLGDITSARALSLHAAPEP